MASLWGEGGECGKIVSGTLRTREIGVAPGRQRTGQRRRGPLSSRQPLLWRMSWAPGVFVPPNRDAKELPCASIDVCKGLGFLLREELELAQGCIFKAALETWSFHCE